MMEMIASEIEALSNQIAEIEEKLKVPFSNLSFLSMVDA